MPTTNQSTETTSVLKAYEVIRKWHPDWSERQVKSHVWLVGVNLAGHSDNLHDIARYLIMYENLTLEDAESWLKSSWALRQGGVL